MCGIVGIAGPLSSASPDILNAMVDCMAHRGPDDRGTWRSENNELWLGHRRLAVIDLSTAGHQPMLDQSGDLCVTFNGEIYNYIELRDELRRRGHSFRTNTDTEVILAAYREWMHDCLSHLSGMFAFCIYDRRRQELFLARDRVGEKPMFYYHDEKDFMFASELKALLSHPKIPRELNISALSAYFTYGYVPADLCILAGAHKLRPGTAMTFALGTGRIRSWQYWKLPTGQVFGEAPLAGLVDELELLLQESVRRQLVADVPTGILLSGGLDSGLIAAMAARVSSAPVNTFTVSFPGHGVHDEGPAARTIADYLGTNHTELVLENTAVDILPSLARQYDEPMADSSMVPTYLLSSLIRNRATVALGGDGGDELFGGYPHYNWVQRLEQLRPFVPARVRRGLAVSAARLPTGWRGRNHAIGFGESLARSIAHINVYFDASSRAKLLAPLEHLWGFDLEGPEGYKIRACGTGSALQQATRVDFVTYLPDDLLVKIDRASMLASLELRAPWLDHQLVEFAFGRVPDHLRATAKVRKVLPRLLADRLLPGLLDPAKKQGFSLPMRSWFEGSWGSFISEVLRDSDSSIFDQREIQRLLADQRKGGNNAHRLFAIAMFELWRRDYGFTLPAEETASGQDRSLWPQSTIG